MAIKNSKELLHWIRSAVPMPDQPFALAIIQSEDPLYISFEGDIDDNGYPIVTTTAMTAIDSYAPSLGDRVIMVNTGRTWLILGSIPSDTSSARRLVDLSVGSFVNFDQNEMPMCFFLSGNRQITLEGTIQPRVGISAGLFSLVGTLPDSARPGSRVFSSALYATNSTTMVPVRIEINPNGNIYVANPTALTATTGSITILMSYMAEAGVSALARPNSINTTITIPKPIVGANTNALVFPSVINPPAIKIPAPIVTTPPNDTFIYGVTKPDHTTGNVGLQVPESSLTTVTSIAPVSNTSYSNKKFNCYVNLDNISNAKFTNCWFNGAVSGLSTFWNNVLVKRTTNGGTTKGDSTDVIGRWGKQGQNYFKFCKFGDISPQYRFDSLLFGNHWYLDRCFLQGGTDLTSANNTRGGQNLYVEARGCDFGGCWGTYPAYSSTDGSKTNQSDGTHNDICELTSGSFGYWFGNSFSGRLISKDQTHPKYFIHPPAPSSIALANSCFQINQNVGSGQTGIVTDIEIDTNWFGVGTVCAINIDEQGNRADGVPYGAMKRIKITNNRVAFDGVGGNAWKGSVIVTWGGKYVHFNSGSGCQNWFTNFTKGTNDLTYNDPSTVITGNVRASDSAAIPSPYTDAPA